MQRVVLGSAFAFGLAFATLARAQVPDHLKCYRVTDPLRLKGIVDLDSPQFGLEPGCSLSRAILICVPVSKTVQSAVDAQTGQPITPLVVAGADPGDRICYKIRCATPGPAAQEFTDQFGTRTLVEPRPRKGFKPALVCTPAVKGAPTTTTTSTTTTLPSQCGSIGGGACGGLCPNPGELCVRSPFGGCSCFNCTANPPFTCRCLGDTGCSFDPPGGCPSGYFCALESVDPLSTQCADGLCPTGTCPPGGACSLSGF